MQDSANVFDINIASFEQDVIERSKTTLVLLDFWADWCGPCKQLTPILTKVVESYDGRVVLAKANADEQQELAQHLNVRSLPTVIAVKDGQIVDGFMGAQPEQGIRDLIEKHLPEENVESEGTDWEQMDAPQALAEVEAAITANPEDLDLCIDKLNLLIRLGDCNVASSYLDKLDQGTQLTEDRVKNFRLRIEMLNMAAAVTEQELLSTLKDEPDNWEATSQLGALKVRDENYAEAMEVFLSLVTGNRAYGEDFGRRALLSLFDTVSDDDLVRTYRRRLASTLF